MNSFTRALSDAVLFVQLLFQCTQAPRDERTVRQHLRIRVSLGVVRSVLREGVVTNQKVGRVNIVGLILLSVSIESVAIGRYAAKKSYLINDVKVPCSCTGLASQTHTRRRNI